MAKSPDRTTVLLQQWHDGDRCALEELLERNLSWLHGYVRQRMGGKLRERLESVDFVQGVAMDVLQYSPRFVVADEAQFRALLGKMLENNLAQKNAWLRAAKRDQDRENPLAGCQKHDNA